jgi:hypothetical protein
LQLCVLMVISAVLSLALPALAAPPIGAPPQWYVDAAAWAAPCLPPATFLGWLVWRLWILPKLHKRAKETPDKKDDEVVRKLDDASRDGPPNLGGK